MAPTSPTDHDALYHRLFSHAGVVAQLLRAFAGGPWLRGLDLDGMVRLNAKFHADTGERREGDMVWRIPRAHGQDSYLVLLLEFQSTSDTYMALRILTYAGLIWQQLVRERRLASDGRLPPLLPVVVYNGDARWGAPVSLHTLVGLPKRSALWRWQPGLQYHVIDAGGFSEDELNAREGLPALWFRMEGAASPGEAVAAADAVLAWLGRHPEFAAVRGVFAELLGAVVAPLRPGIRVPEDLLEMRNMLATRAEKWIQNWEQQGIQKGMQKGLQQGLQQGLQKGEAALLLRQMERRFGALPGWVTDRVLAADTQAIEAWGLRILDAASLDDMFERPE
jgi:hypothetical protein